ncbi:DUF2911 domain-containing protein [Psychroflexus salis]|uniref:DUF2911 domain-containing protein n=1 Tax=Psychroflexus salis TaxID=1526574 RepID=A0A917E6J8_9FLAO|nr:DUF2911 domain-containing protein [Psychroflexus salis]GGE05541.1 hypothetical protein GCM10010831_04030 [Psychroflexus salis]
MKHIFNLVIALLSFCTFAQVTTPQASPSAKTEQVVGLTTIELNYSRPAVNGRTIFGDLVPFNKKWRTGANANTSIGFSDDVKIEGVAVKAGNYALYSTPTNESWVIYLYTKTDNWGLPEEWNEDLVAAKFEVKSTKTRAFTENFSLQIVDISANQAKLEIAWENTKVQFNIEVPTEQKVMQSIKKTMQKEPSARDYYNAAVYFLNEGIDIKQAVSWIDTAMKMEDKKPYWMLRQQALIYYQAGMQKKAIKIAEASLEAAKKAGNNDYVKMNKDSIEKWKQ